MTCILMLSGLPGSGKSTLSHLLSKSEALCEKYRICVVSYDELIPPEFYVKENDCGEEVHYSKMDSPSEATVKTAKWKGYRKNIYLCVNCLLLTLRTKQQVTVDDVDRIMWQKFHALVSSQLGNTMDIVNLLIIIDDNMYYRSMRYEYYQLAKRYSIGFCQVHISCPTHVAIAQNRLRTASVPDDVIKTMAARMEPPAPNINTWETYSLCLFADQVSSSLNVVASLVEVAASNPVQQEAAEETWKPKAVSRQVCSTSALHQADQVLRKLVARAISTAKGEDSGSHSIQEFQCFTTKVRQLRTDILDQLRDGFLLVPLGINDVTDASKDEKSYFFKWIENVFNTMKKLDSC